MAEQQKKKKRLPLLVIATVVLASSAAAAFWPRGQTLVLTGIVTTQEVVVSPQIGGRVSQVLAREGDAVMQGQLLAVIEPAELEADRAYYARSAEGYGAQVAQSQAALRYQERDAATLVEQAGANVAAAEADLALARAQADDARLTFERTEALFRDGAASAQDHDHARTSYDAAQARVAAAERQVEARRAALAQARAGTEQIALRRSALEASQAQHAAAEAQKARADVRRAYAELKAPIPGVVDVRAARVGEYVNPGQPVVTLVDPDDLWVRADVEESYIDRIHLGDHLTVRLPSGAEREGTVILRGVDAGFATQRDVSRTKRDIRTFEVRLRVDNRDRALAVGMTSYVLLPVAR